MATNRIITTAAAQQKLNAGQATVDGQATRDGKQYWIITDYAQNQTHHALVEEQYDAHTFNDWFQSRVGL